jgi:hypothetical protein
MSMTALAGDAPKILVHGHRGARAVRPENTIPAFEYAIAAGADVHTGRGHGPLNHGYAPVAMQLLG